jgi:hypothetical protein
MKTGKQKITSENTHGILNTHRRQFFHFRDSILQQAIEKLQLKLSISTTAIYPYEKPLLTVSQDCPD